MPPPAATDGAETEHVGANAVCQVCKDGGGDDRMLLCEACDVGYHFDCLSPPLEGIPDEAWFCPACMSKFGPAGPPPWTAFGVGDQCVAVFENKEQPDSTGKWICKILDIQGTVALVHFPGWKPKHDLWVERETLETLPGDDVLKHVQRSRLETTKEREKRLRLEEKLSKAQAIQAIEEKLKALDMDKKRLQKLMLSEKEKSRALQAQITDGSSSSGSTPEEVAAAAAAAVGATGVVDGDAGGRLSDEHAACVEQIKAVSESIKELRRSLPPSHHLHLASEKGTASASSGTRRASANKEGKESCDAGVGTAFSSKVTTLDIGDCEDGWNDFCLECGGAGEDGQLLCCDGCPRTFCLQCARLSKAPRGKWYCKPCLGAKQMLATGGGIGSDKLLLQIQRLCEQFPMTHFLGILAFDLARVRTSAEYCRELGISLNGMHKVGTAHEALSKLESLLKDAEANNPGCLAAKHENGSSSGSPAIGTPPKQDTGPGVSAKGQGREGGGRRADLSKVAQKGRKSTSACAMSGQSLSVTDARYSAYEEVVTKFYQDGVCVPGMGLTDVQVEECREAVEQYYNDVKFTIQQKQLQHELEAHGWETFKLRCPGRYDMNVPDLDTEKFKFLREEAPWMDAVYAILGRDCKLHHMGVMLSQPNSQVQNWHSDGDHLSEDEHLTPYAVNVFVPLVDMDASLGPTEFVPTTHLLFNYDPMQRIEPVTFCTKAGQCLLFDYRVKHRGLGNRAGISRPMIYITYGTKAWSDKENFNRKRFPKLPELVKQRAPRSELPSNWRERKRLREVEEALEASRQDLGEGGLSPNKSPKKSRKAFEGAGKDKGKRCVVEAAVSVATEQTKGRGRPKGKGL